MTNKENLPEPKKGKDLQSKFLIPNAIPTWTSEERAALALTLGMVFDIQKQYGKTVDQLETVFEGFVWALGGYNFELVKIGIKKYIQRHSDMPTPSDIINIIDPLPALFKPDWSVYNRYKKLKEEQGKYALNDDEESYMLKCEATSLRNSSKID